MVGIFPKTYQTTCPGRYSVPQILKLKFLLAC